jgi:hydroxyacylglutathione hydrolase
MNKNNRVNVESIITGQLGANCYLVFDHTKKTTIIDPGDDAGYIQQYLHDLELIPDKIVLTHGHFDHCLAAYELQTSLAIPILIHQHDEFLIKDMNKSAKYYLRFDPGPPPKISNYIDSLESINMAGKTWQIIHTPGHTPGSICLYAKSAGMVFVGDLIFAGGGVGRFDFNYSSEPDLNQSVKRILSLPANTHVFPGHGPSTTIGKESQIHHPQA